MSVWECATLDILTRNTNMMAIHKKGAPSHCLTHWPIGNFLLGHTGAGLSYSLKFCGYFTEHSETQRILMIFQKNDYQYSRDFPKFQVKKGTLRTRLRPPWSVISAGWVEMQSAIRWRVASLTPVSGSLSADQAPLSSWKKPFHGESSQWRNSSFVSAWAERIFWVWCILGISLEKSETYL